MDIFYKEKKSYILAAFAAFAACFVMIINSDMAVYSAKKGIGLWLSNVVPAMLPFFICVNFLSATGTIRYLPSSIFPFIMSVMSGYPMGAKITGDMYRNGDIDLCRAKMMVSFCSTSGPVFIIGAVGTGILASQEAGVIAALAHYLGAICNGAFYSLFYRGSSTACHTAHEPVEYSLVEKFTESIFSACKSLTVILAYIILFMFIIDLTEYAGLFDMIPSVTGQCLAKGFMEMTVGCSYIPGAAVSLKHSCVMAAVIISWGGLSIIGQSASMLSGTGISVFYIILTKLTHSIFAGIIALFISTLML